VENGRSSQATTNTTGKNSPNWRVGKTTATAMVGAAVPELAVP
jgi:hypothetical protein